MKTIAKIALSLCSLFASVADAQTRQGYDVLALARYCDTYLKAPKLPAVSTLLGTFGDPLPCIEKSIKAGGLKVVQVDLRDATCFRNRVCPPTTPSLTDWKVLKQKASEVAVLAKRYPQVEWWVSPWLEHDIKDENTVRMGCQVVKDACPSCRCINSPMSGATPAGIPVEKHGTKITAFAVSGDGASSFDGDNLRSDGNNFEHRVSGGNQTYVWWNELNLRCTGEKTFTPPMSRTERPTDDQFRQAYLLMQPEKPVPPAPSFCKTVVRVDARKGELIKTNAEAYCNGQTKGSRDNKPLLIISKAGRVGDRMKLYNSKGTEVGCFAYFGTYSDSRLRRWYIGSCSGQAPAALYDALGGEWGFTDMGGGTCLLTNVIRRMGVYR